jgi:hypothetical protein
MKGMSMRTLFLSFLAAAISCGTLAAQTVTPTKPADEAKPIEKKPEEKKADANGNPLRIAKNTGHVSNYEEAKVPPYTLPDPLKLSSGEMVKDANTWITKRRPEILKLYENEIYGRVPKNAPTVAWQTDAEHPNTIVGRVGNAEAGPKLNLVIHKPKLAGEHHTSLPVVICLNFNFPAGAMPKNPAAASPVEIGNARGWAVATLNYTDIQADKKDSFDTGVIGQTLSPGQTTPAADEWGTISAWSWGLSRAIDYLLTQDDVDPNQIIIHGHSRLGKTVLWCAAQDERVKAVFSSCSGEMGASLARRDFGESVDDMAQNFPWQFCGNFQKYPGHWNDMPVDSHMLISLIAPRLVFISGGDKDLWADPHGEYLAMVAAGPVFKLLGCEDFGDAPLPPLDQPRRTKHLGFSFHAGGHFPMPAEWQTFLEMCEKRFANR